MALYDYTLTLGQIAEKDIIAPFEFNIYKSEETLLAERETEAAKVHPIYKVSDDLKFNAQKNLDFIVQIFINSRDLIDDNVVRNKLQQNGYLLTPNTINYLLDETKRNNIYNYLTEEFTRIFDIGIYPNNYPYQKIEISKGNRIFEYSLSRLYSLQEAKEKLLDKITDPEMKQVAKELADIILLENIVVDNEMSKLEKQKARESVPLTLGKVLKNEKIVSKNQKVTAIEILKLDSMLKAQKEQNLSKNNFQLLTSSLGVFIISLFLLYIFNSFLGLFFPADFTSSARFIIICCCVVGSILLTILVNNILQTPSLMIPVALTVFIVAIIFNPNVGILYNFINFFYVVLFLNWSFLNPAIHSFAALAGIIALKKMKRKQEFYPLAVYLFLSFLLILTSVTLISFETLSTYLTQLLFGFISILITIMGIVLLIPLIERKLNLATKQILLELLDFENPLLKKMSIQTPGTYHHSLIVGNLAESAAEAVGANHLLARVGSYYHDIGKTENPQLFIENNPKSSDLHDQMLANESSLMIRRHIQDGINLARKYNLPQPVIDIIEQHHGTGQIKFFFNKAQETNLMIDEEDFYYKGPKPKTKEAAIVMIADIVESTTKSLVDFSEDTIRKVLNDTIFRLINEDQLTDAPLTMAELEKIKTYMLPIIMGVYRKRLEYPEN